jgi:hypothetical protein
VTTLLVAVAAESRNALNLNRKVQLKVVLKLRDLRGLQNLIEFGPELGICKSACLNRAQLAVYSDIDLSSVRFEVNVGAAHFDAHL